MTKTDTCGIIIARMSGVSLTDTPEFYFADLISDFASKTVKLFIFWRSDLSSARRRARMSVIEVLTLLLLIATIIDIVVGICNNKKK